MGSPFSLPASLLTWLRGGPAPPDYESLYMQRPHARWSLRMGLDDRIFLEDGWSEPLEREGVSFRRLERESAGLVVPVHKPVASRVGSRLRAEGDGPVRVRVFVNQRVMGSWTAGSTWSDEVLDVPAEALHAGRNSLRLRRIAGAGPAAPVLVAGIWLEPAATSAAPVEAAPGSEER
jgi:hypothetical protein